jgi:hypothetical protein
MAFSHNISLYSSNLSVLEHMHDEQLVKMRIQIWIPREYHQEPILSRLMVEFGLLVNITGAKLGPDTDGHGWFDLELNGKPSQIQKGLSYLRELDLKISGKPNSDGDGWHY